MPTNERSKRSPIFEPILKNVGSNYWTPPGNAGPAWIDSLYTRINFRWRSQWQRDWFCHSTLGICIYWHFYLCLPDHICVCIILSVFLFLSLFLRTKCQLSWGEKTRHFQQKSFSKSLNTFIIRSSIFEIILFILGIAFYWKWNETFAQRKTRKINRQMNKWKRWERTPNKCESKALVQIETFLCIN